MRGSQKLLAVASAGIALAASMGSAEAFTLTSFDPQVVFSGTGAGALASLDAAVGIEGFVIEDFEDVTLDPLVTVEFEGLGELSVVSAADIPNTLPNAIWDGTRGLNPVLTSAEPDLILRFIGGALSVGIGLSDFEGDTRIFVDGEDLGIVRELPNYNRVGDNAREVYVRIDADASEIIHSVSLRLPLQETADGLLIDRVAFQSVPEPSSATLLALGLCGIASLRRIHR